MMWWIVTPNTTLQLTYFTQWPQWSWRQCVGMTKKYTMLKKPCNAHNSEMKHTYHTVCHHEFSYSCQAKLTHVLFLHYCQLQWTTLLPTAVNYTAANCSELQMLISIADFIFRENQMFKIIWALTSGCGSCIIWLMLSYFFSLSSYLTDNILNLIRTLPPTPTYTAQNSFNLPQTWQPDLTSLGNWGVTHSHNSIIYETTSKQSYQLTLKIWM